MWFKRKLKHNGLPYQLYAAKLAQAGTAAPTVSVIFNTLSGAGVFARSGAGVYTFTLTGAFTANKTAVSVSNAVMAGGRVNVARTSANVITVTTFDASDAAADGVIGADNVLEIKVFQ